MRAPTRIMRENGISQEDVVTHTGQGIQYTSMQLNGHRPLTLELLGALRELLPTELADQVICSVGKK